MEEEQLVGEALTAEMAAIETDRLDEALFERIDPNMVEGWDIKRILWRVFRDAGELNHENLIVLAELEISYCRCDYDAALERANYLIEHADAPIALYARTMRMNIMVARGDGEQAYEDLLVLKEKCALGLAQTDDVQMLSASVVCALRIEGTVMASLFNLPRMIEGIDVIPVGLKLYFGYLFAMRYLRLGRYHEAYGMALAYQTIINVRYPGSRTYLYCVEASAKMIMGDVQEARALFDEAWKLKEEYGILMPFIDLNYALLGLTRMNREELAAPGEIQRIEKLISSYSKGWYCLRKKCGLPVVTEALTPLESYASGLVALGWRNKEIAKHLLISESTVKHQLTSVYQKLHVTSRADLQELYRTASKSPQGFDVWA